MIAPFAPGVVRVGCSVTLRIARDGREGVIEWLITKGRTRVEEGVLGRRTRLARCLLGRRVGDVVPPEEAPGRLWIRIEAIEFPVDGRLAALEDPVVVPWVGGLTVRIAYDEGWNLPIPESEEGLPGGAEDGD